MRKNVHNTSGIRVHITGAFRNYGKNGAPMEEYFGKKLRTHQSEIDEGCHHCKKIRLSADHKRIREKSGAGEKACAKCRTGTVWNDITVGAGVVLNTTCLFYFWLRSFSRLETELFLFVSLTISFNNSCRIFS